MIAKKFASVFLTFALPRAAGSAFGFALSVVLPFVLSLPDVGRVYLAISAVSFMSILQNFGLDYLALNTALVSDGKPKTIAAIYLGTLRRMCFSSACIFVCGVAFLLFAQLYFGHMLISWAAATSIFIWAFGASVANILFQLYKANGQTLMATLARGFFLNFVYASSIVVALLFGCNLNFEEVLMLYAILTILVAIVSSLIFIARTLDWSLKSSLPIISMASKNGNRVYFLYVVFSNVLNNLDLWFVFWLLNAESVAVYATAKRFTVILTLLVDFSSISVPRRLAAYLRDGALDEAQAFLQKFSTQATILAIPVVFVFYLTADPLVELLYKGKMPSLLLPLIIMLVAQLLNLGVGFADQVILASKVETYRLLLVATTCVAIIAQFCVTLLLFLFWPNIAAPIGHMFGIIVYRVSLAILVKRKTGITTHASFSILKKSLGIMFKTIA
jgi:O-antigen/teichoic acid export membrane protein